MSHNRGTTEPLEVDLGLWSTLYSPYFILLFYRIWDLQRIHCYLDQDSAKLLATALVSSRLDYCNSL